ncbi:MAG: indolepyruvate ferredoxin oxidoreductase subunit alpha [Dehalococcoidales bacterium]|nr:indolepyruvate ferredoxin oxidoreductase subunit alpha [Dehalococcoidales bacterium]
MVSKLLLKDAPGTRILAMGNDAIARGAIEAGVKFATAYPGTPSTEILEALIELAPESGMLAYWSINEKVAIDAAVGASFTNMRALVCMKHVGLNVAADTLNQANLIDVGAGLVLFVVDDAGGFSSNNEQDSRWYSRLAEVPMFEPTTIDEARQLVPWAFALSERLKVLVLLRTVTRLAHMTGPLTLGAIEQVPAQPYFDTSHDWTPFPPLEPHRKLKEKMRQCEAILRDDSFDRLTKTGGQTIGVAATGFSYNAAREMISELGLETHVAVLKVSTVNPAPRAAIASFLEGLERVLVVEDGNAFLEEQVRQVAGGMGRPFELLGRRSNSLPDVGEILPDHIRQATLEVVRGRIHSLAGIEPNADASKRKEILSSLPGRNITFCPGCPHRATYYALASAVEQARLSEPIIIGDIGCYAIGFNEPFCILKAMTSMGGSVGMACSIAELNRKQRVVAVIGDSTFFHAGMPAIIQISHRQLPVVILIVDNGVTASTGQQPHPGTRAAAGPIRSIAIENVVRGFGLQQVEVVNSFRLSELTARLKEALGRDGPSVVISRRICALDRTIRGKRVAKAQIDQERCDQCLECIKAFGCPAFSPVTDELGGTGVEVDPTWCDGCAVCVQVCPTQAIRMVHGGAGIVEAPDDD